MDGNLGILGKFLEMPHELRIELSRDGSVEKIIFRNENATHNDPPRYVSGPGFLAFVLILLTYREWQRRHPGEDFDCEEVLDRSKKTKGVVSTFCDALLKSEAKWIRSIFGGATLRIFKDAGNWHGRNPVTFRRLRICSSILPADNCHFTWDGVDLLTPYDDLQLAKVLLRRSPWKGKRFESLINTPGLFETFPKRRSRTSRARRPSTTSGRNEQTAEEFNAAHNNLPPMPQEFVPFEMPPLPKAGILEIIGQGGSGKSTLATVMSHRWIQYSGNRAVWFDCQILPNREAFYHSAARQLGASIQATEWKEIPIEQIATPKTVFVFDHHIPAFEGLDFQKVLMEFSHAAPVILTGDFSATDAFRYQCRPLEKDSAEKILSGGIAKAVMEGLDLADREVGSFIRFIEEFADGNPLNLMLALGLIQQLGEDAFTSETQAILKGLTTIRPPADSRYLASSALLDFLVSTLRAEDRRALYRLAIIRGGLRETDARSVLADDFSALLRLRDLRLIQAWGERYSVAPIVRELLLERLTPKQYAEHRSAIEGRLASVVSEGGEFNAEQFAFTLRQICEFELKDVASR